MATFLGYSNFNGKNGSKFSADLLYDILEQNIEGNYTRVMLYGYIRSWGYSGSGSWATFYINGANSGGFNRITANQYSEVARREVRIDHDGAGNGTLNWSLRVDTSWSLGDASASGSIGLPNIPRKPSFNSITHGWIEEKKVVLSASVDTKTLGITSSGWDLSTNGGQSSKRYNGSLSSLTITDLQPNTKYWYRGICTTVAGTATSGWQTFTTYDYPKPTSTNNFVIGNGATVNLYNPLGRNVKLEILQKGTNKILGTYSGTYNGNVNSEFKTQGAIDNQYKSIPSSKSGKYYAKVTYGSIVKTYDNNNYYIIKQTDDEKPTFKDTNIINVVDNKNVAITGNSSLFIKNHNNLIGEIKPMSGNKYASVSKGYYSVSSSGLNAVTVNYATPTAKFILGNVNTNSISVDAVDERGMSRNVSKTITIVDYFNPYTDECSLLRKNGIDEYVNLKASGKYTNWKNLKQANSIKSVKYRFKETNSSTWTSWKALPTGFKLTNSNGNWTVEVLLSDKFSNLSSYDLQLEIKDLLETVVSATYKISTANALLWRDLQNGRLGVGKKPDYKLDVKGIVNAEDIYKNGEPFNSKTSLVLKLEDTRNDNQNPSWYMTKYRNSLIHEFKTSSKINNPPIGHGFADVITLIPWRDSSGGYPTQLAIMNNKIAIRSGKDDTTWNGWSRVLTNNSCIVALASHDRKTVNGGNFIKHRWDRITISDSNCIKQQNGALIIQESGIYEIIAHVRWDDITGQNTTNSCGIGIAINGNAGDNEFCWSFTGYRLTTNNTFVLNLRKNDILEMQSFSDTSSALQRGSWTFKKIG